MVFIRTTNSDSGNLRGFSPEATINADKTLFAQFMDFLPWTTFARYVQRYGGDCLVRAPPCAEHFRFMAFAQLTNRGSLRDVEVCLSAQAGKLHRMGLCEPVKCSTLADARELQTGESTPTSRRG